MVEAFNNKIFKTVLKFLGWLLVFWLLGCAEISGLYPFWLGLYIAVAVLRRDMLFITIPFMLGGVLSNISVETAIIYCAAAIIGILISIIHKSHKKRVAWLLPLYCALASIPFLYFGLGSDLIYSIISTAFNMIFALSSFHFIRALNKRRNLRLSTDEGICGSIILMGLFCGLSGFIIGDFNLPLLVAASVILLVTYTCPTGYAAMLSLSIGLGLAFGSGEHAYISLICSMGLLSTIFKTRIRLYSSIVVTLITVLMGLYFGAFSNFGILDIVAVMVPCSLILIVPEKWLQHLSVFTKNEGKNYITQNIVSDNKVAVSKTLKQTADVFYEMDRVFRSLVKGNLPAQDAKKMLTCELIQGVCDNCPEKSRCLRQMNGEFNDVFISLINTGFEKGKITLLDIPQTLTTKCVKVNTLVSAVNGLLNSYKEYSSTITNLDSSRVLIAEQLLGVSRVLNNLSDEVGSRFEFDYDLAQKIKDELEYLGITLNEVFVYKKGEKLGINIAIKNTDAENSEILKTVNKICRASFMLTDIRPTEVSGLSTMIFEVAPRYQVAFGLAQAFKNNDAVGGDTHSVTNINNQKFLLAVCDGMGAGEEAQKVSSLAIGLIENFYKAGFDNDTVLSSVNRLLNLGRSDVFSALDVCVIDQSLGLVDFVKLGASAGFIKHGNMTDIIESGALPLGILEDIKPRISRTGVEVNDMIVLTSDGISDAFETTENLQQYINNLSTKNPQEMAAEILDRAKELNHDIPKDDMTVLVCRITA
ncbi:MAG: SpoIIE family protein phosphatase [Christensenellaceae bacterium]|jgi:stage II sporulation protein E|nr:SpoIIE family protein phosphatase [Christensenellaceae bacterium]